MRSICLGVWLLKLYLSPLLHANWNKFMCFLARQILLFLKHSFWVFASLGIQSNSLIYTQWIIFPNIWAGSSYYSLTRNILHYIGRVPYCNSIAIWYNKRGIYIYLLLAELIHRSGCKLRNSPRHKLPQLQVGFSMTCISAKFREVFFSHNTLIQLNIKVASPQRNPTYHVNSCYKQKL